MLSFRIIVVKKSCLISGQLGVHPVKKKCQIWRSFIKQNGKEIEILAVNIDPQFNVQQFVTEFGITFPILLDEKDEVNTMYQLLTIPTTYFIDEKGIIRHKYLTSYDTRYYERIYG